MNIKTCIISLALTAGFSSSILFAAVPVTAEQKKQLQSVVDKYYKTYRDKEQFTAIAASVLIPTERQLDPEDIHSFVAGNIGFAPLDQSITTNNLFEIGSITKSFVSAILLQLQIEKTLSLTDTVGKWLPEYPQWKNVTLRSLLNMTSGIPNYSNDPEFLKKLYGNLSHVWSNKELLHYAYPDKPIKMNKENRYEYSNSNYILAALIIEKATKDTFVNQLNQRILKQKNLVNTYYLAGPDGSKVKKSLGNRLIHGYFYDKKTSNNVDIISNDLSWAGPAGAMVATTENVVEWVQTLYHGLLFNPRYREDTLADLETVVSTKTGQTIPTVSEQDPSGFGLGVAYVYDKESKQRFWFYEGSTLGFRVMYLWQPCNGVTTVVALNSKAGQGEPDSKLGDKIAVANLDLYKTLMRLYPDLRCES